MNRLVFILVFFVATSRGACAAQDSDPLSGIDAFLDSLAIVYNVPGYSFAAFDDQRVLHRRAGGYKNTHTKEPVDLETVFEAASISKPVFAYVVLTLAQQGGLPLDSSLGATEPVVRELGYDIRSDMLTPRVLLSHQGGLPNWRTRMNFTAPTYVTLFGPNDTLRFVADPGSTFRYSGEGYVLLQQAIEQATQEGLNDLARAIVFQPLGMTHSSYLFDSHMQVNASWGHDAEGRPDKWTVTLPLASSTLHTTATDLAAFGVHLASGVRDGKYFAPLADSVVYVGSREGWKGYWGLGLGTVTDGEHTYMYHGGNNVIFLADFVYGFTENLGYALLTNSANGDGMIEMLERRIYGGDIPR